jgi:hypothetical protein
MSATVSYPTPGRWLGMLLRGQPHQIIRNSYAPYLHRWYLLPRNRRLNVYLQTLASSELLNCVSAAGAGECMKLPHHNMSR